MKRITISVSDNIDIIRERLSRDTGIRMTYVQLVNYLVHYYMTKSSEPRTQWVATK